MSLTKEQVQRLFASDAGKGIDVIFETPDGQIFLDEQMARKASKTITIHYRSETEAQIRKKFSGTPLGRMILATDHVKAAFKRKDPRPMYSTYQTMCTGLGEEAIAQESFDFIVTNVYDKEEYEGLIMQRIHIQTPNGPRIISAELIRDFGLNKLFYVRHNDTLVMTCETNIELMYGDVKRMFSPVMFAAGPSKEEVAHHRV